MKTTITFILILFPLIIESQVPMIIAHRGASYDAPENTIAAVNLAWEKDADAVEVDVHLSLDKRIMVIHDKDTRRTSGTKMLVGDTHSDDLRNLEVGSFKDQEYAGEKIPFLEEVIRTVPAEKILFIEVKSDTSILPHLIGMIRNSPRKDRLVVISFDFNVVSGMKTGLPEVPAY